MEETRKEEKTPRFRIEPLEERIAPAPGCATALENIARGAPHSDHGAAAVEEHCPAG